MNNVTQFRREMQPARPFPEGALPSDDYPQTADTIIRSQAAAISELQQTVRELTTAPMAGECFRQDGREAVAILVERFGAATVARWVRNLAAITGEAI